MSPRSLSLGGLDEATHLIEGLRLPIIENLEVRRWMDDALLQATAERKGVVVVGKKGTGKTIAVQKAVHAFEDAERTKEEEDAKYRRQRVVVVQSPRAKGRTDVIGVLWKAVTGTDMVRHRRGRRKPDDDLLQELVHQLLGQNITALVLDEAENLSPAALEVLRDVISRAESTSEGRLSRDGTEYAAAGVGVVLVGTPRLTPRLSESEEAGHRWVRFRSVDTLKPEQAADIYRRYLPAFDERAEQVGEDAWQEMIRVQVCVGHRVPIRTIENHVRAYVRRMALDDPEISSVEEIPYDEEVFGFTLSELAAENG